MILPHTSVNLRKRDYLLLMELPTVYGNALKTAPPSSEQKRAAVPPSSPSQPPGDPSRVSSPPVVPGSTDFAVLLYLTEGTFCSPLLLSSLSDVFSSLGWCTFHVEEDLPTAAVYHIRFEDLRTAFAADFLGRKKSYVKKKHYLFLSR
jgi:hypothetical protein